MKKTSLLFLISLVFSLLCLFYFEPSSAQIKSSDEHLIHKQAAPFSTQLDKLKRVPQIIKNSKSTGVNFDKRELFQSANTIASAVRAIDSTAKAEDDDAQLREVLTEGVSLTLNKPAIESLLKEKAEFLTLPLPDGNGGTIELELVRVNIFAPGFTVKTSAPTTETVDESLGIHYRGIVKGNDRSLAAISVFKNEVMGFYSTEADGNSILGRLGGNNPTDKHILYAEKDLKASPEFHCETKDPEVTLPTSVLQEQEAVIAKCIRIYIEADYDLFLNKGSVSSTTSYLTAIFNQSATLFANDGIPVSLSEILVWNVQSPYAGLNSTDAMLSKFQAIRNSFNGDLGHLVALRGGGGLAASLNAFCNSNIDARQCFSSIYDYYNTVPTYSWTVSVFTHEMGHLMGSPHTHACSWNGNGTAIDGCGPAAGYSYEGSCSGAPIPPSGGTIMSYCHLSPNPGINFNFGFGSQPKNLILSRFNASTCLLDCGGSCATPVPINVGETISGTLSTSDCRYPTGSSWYSDAYTFNGTAGQQVAISMSSSSLDTWVALQDPSGTELIYDDNGGGGTNSRIPAGSGFYTLPSSGTYKIQASSALTNATGSYTVSLTGQTFTIGVSASPVVGGTVGGGGTFAAGSSRTVTAMANTGYTFVNWTQSGSVVSSSASYTFILNSNRTLVANFMVSSVSYDSVLKAPKCGQVGSLCDSGTLLNGRDNISDGPEQNQPNTINNSCADGTSGTYHADESIDAIKVSTLDGTSFAPGKTVKIDTTVWAYQGFSSDHLDLYYAADASNPNWAYITTLEPSGAGTQVLSTTYTLPSGGSLQAVRARFRFGGAAASCSTNSGFDDNDDLIFALSTPVTRTLTVGSSNPGSGVSLTVSPVDNSGAGSGTTQFIRTYNNNAVVSLTAPSTAGGNNFQKWQRGGVDYSSSQSINVTMDANYTVTAVYVSPCLSVTGIAPTFGAIGSNVTITGNNFTGVTSVKFSNNISAGFSVNSNTQITATVPSGAVTGPITIGKTGCGSVPTATFSIPGSRRTALGDFDGDGKSDIAVWRALNGTWYAINSSTGASWFKQWGDKQLGDIPVARDFDGDGKTDVAVWRAANGVWYITNSSDNSVRTQQWGSPSLGDVAVPADYDGDGKADIAVWRPLNGTWYYIQSSDGAQKQKQWGAKYLGDVPIAGDYDGDGKADVAVWRASNGTWYITNSSNNSVGSQQWGEQSMGDVPVLGDFNGDGRADIAVWRPSNGTWYYIQSSDGAQKQVQWGANYLGDVPTPADYDGDGKADIAVWRASTGTWYYIQSSDGTGKQKQWGAQSLGDVPIEKWGGIP